MGAFSNSFVQRLQSRLREPLPGREVQYLMAPDSRKVREIITIEPQNPKSSSVLIALNKREDHWVFPIIQRPEYNGMHSGQVSLPGGKMEDTDRDLHETAIRETSEEIGINTEGLLVLGELTDIYVHVSDFNILPVVAYLPGIQEYHPDEEEVVDVMEISLEGLLDGEKVKRTQIEIGPGISITTPYYDFHNKIIWGATAMILSEFAHILREISE
ncbi:NUDIX hydrolase [Bacteroidota bacterium]